MSIGLTYIRELHNMTMQDIGDILGGISKAVISKWESRQRLIPENRLNALSEYFHLDKVLFEKELNQLDKLMIQKQVLLNTSDIKKVEDSIIDCEGIKHTFIREIYPEGVEEKLFDLNLRIEKEQIKQKIGKVIDKYYGCRSEESGIIDIIAELIDSNKVNKDKVLQILTGVILYYGLEEGTDSRKLVEETIVLLRKDEERDFNGIVEPLNFKDQLTRSNEVKKQVKLEMLMKIAELFKDDEDLGEVDFEDFNLDDD